MEKKSKSAIKPINLSRLRLSPRPTNSNLVVWPGGTPMGDPWRGAWKDVTYQIWRKLCSFVHRFHHDQETHAHTYKLEVIIHNKNTQLLFLDFWCCAIWNGVAEVYIWQQVSGSKTLDVQSGFHRWGWEWGPIPQSDWFCHVSVYGHRKGSGFTTIGVPILE